MPFRSYFIVLIGMVLVNIIAGCTRGTELRRGEYLLASQNIKGNKEIPNEELESLLPQEPNRVLITQPITPFLWVYQIVRPNFIKYKKPRFEQELIDYQRQIDQLKNQADSLRNRKTVRKIERLERKIDHNRLAIEQGHWWMRVVGEPPSIITEEDARENAQNLQAFLRTNRGMFDDSVHFELDTVKFRRVRVRYLVEQRKPYILNQVQLHTIDPRVDSILRTTKSPLKSGDRVDERYFSAERERIELTLKNNGYYGFSKEDVSFTGTYDTSKAEPVKHQVNVKVNIDSIPNRYPYYHLRSVTFVVDGRDPEEPASYLDSTTYQGIRYIFADKKYATKLLNAKITVRPGELYSLQHHNETLRFLGTLDQFKFPNISYDTAYYHQLNALIYAQPLKRFELTSEVGMNVYQGLPGPFLNGSLRIRNFLQGLEMLEIAGKAGFDGQPGFTESSQNLNFKDQNFEAGLNTSLIFPQLLFPGSLKFRYNNSSPRTQIGIGYSLSDRKDFRRTGFKLAMTYSWQISPKETFYFSPIDINLINTTRQSAEFQAFLLAQQEAGNNLIYTFNRSFVSSISGSYVYSDNNLNAYKRTRYFRWFVESGGTTLNFLSQKKQDELASSTDLRFYKFLKTSVDYRLYVPLNRRGKSMLVFRGFVGIGWEYSKAGGVLPYEKAFFAGGANSMRGWNPRKLGLGSLVASYDTLKAGGIVPVYKYESPGEMQLEFNAEWRFPLFKLFGDFNGAIFMDAGNVWRIRGTQPLTIFHFNSFLQQTALDAGFGLRFDKSFFILRADWGIKIYEPGRPRLDGSYGQWVIGDLFSKTLDNRYKPELRFGIGYPF
ncbi:MAG: BamA/TamA family outer membrane protein [Siphonobacter sp.]